MLQAAVAAAMQLVDSQWYYMGQGRIFTWLDLAQLLNKGMGLGQGG
jgi:hypothetical protein